MLDIKILCRRHLNLEVIYLLLIMSLGVMVPLLAFNGSFHVAGGDMTHPEFDISTSIERSMYLWQSSKGLGVNEFSTIPALFPYYASIWVLEAVGFSAEATQKILLIVVFALAGPTMFYLMRTLFPARKHLHAAFIAALFYLFNFFNLQIFWQPYINYQLAYAMMPVLLGLYIKGMKTGDRKYLCYFTLISLFNASSALNYALIVVQLLVLFSYTLWVFAFSENRTILIKRIAQYGIVFFASSSFWLIPAIVWYFTATKSYGLGEIIRDNLAGQIFLTGQYGIPINTFRLWGFGWFFKDGFEWSIPIHVLYTQNAFLVLLSFVPPLMAFSALLFIRKGTKRGVVLFFSMLALVGLFLMKGTAPPFGEVFKWLLNNSAAFLYLFKSPFNKIGLVAVLSFAVLIGFTVNELGTRVKRKSALLIIMLLASFAISGLIFPYWTGDAVRPRFKVNIPSAYSEVGQYLNSDNNSFRVLPLPIFTVNNFKCYTWGYSGAGIDQYFFSNPLVDKSFGVGSLETEHAIDLLQEAINNEDNARVAGLCRQYGIGWIVYHNDADPTFYNENLHLDSVKSILNTSPFVLEKSFGALDLFKIDGYLPRIYTPDIIVNYLNGTDPSDYYLLVCDPLSINNSVTKNPLFLSSLKMDNLEKKNLIENPSFENKTLWGSVSDVTPQMAGKADLSAIQSTDATDGNYSLQLSTKSHTAALATKIANFSSSTYTLSFDYKYISGNAPRFAIFQSGSELCDPAMALSKENKWQHFEVTFRLRPNTTDLYLFLYADPVPGDETTVLYDNVIVSKVITATTIETPKEPELAFKNINPTKYVVNITGATEPYYLVLSESFSPYWKAYVVDMDKSTNFGDTLFANPLPEENHFEVNGYANAWYIKKPGNYTIIIEFWSQQFVYLGLVISALTAVLALVTLGLVYRRIGIHHQQDRKVDGGSIQTVQTQVDALEHEGAGEPAEHTSGEVLQPESLRQTEGKLLKPREEDNYSNKDSIGGKVNQLTDSTKFLLLHKA